MNHGVELHTDVVDYAKERLAEFKSKCIDFDAFEFCEPWFVVGNCLQLSSSCGQYQRVYCGAACPPEHANYMKNLLTIGGILVMPINDQVRISFNLSCRARLVQGRSLSATYEASEVIASPKIPKYNNFIYL